ncbi:ATP-dependent Clp protease proteolytic subunit [Cupriavidus yeoncheonensis]|uniref:ATP-dependent Clp protease proteolytic subunit n=1 Tax=Cupriavidus yeoncheonensis TaxID=1462994 RepID=A0A916IPE9_9BURK|nr:head maturation protease, ClpP-related [Cupriavidus yeoncheonensis]CAG2126903.1 ATP-dependent Clp protease proteolytic subunit [Cupriavidus yeoncheonensis]
MKDWYKIVARTNGQAAQISVFDEIGAWGVSAKMFIADLKALGDVKKIAMDINSPGGSVFDALAMYNALRASGAEITVKVLGVAASAASLLAMAGDKIIMPENAFMMVHNPINGVYGNSEDMRDMADVLDKIGASLVSTYVARTGRTEEEVKALLAAETLMSAADAVAQGFADEVAPALNVQAVFDYDRLPTNVQALFKTAANADDASAAAAKAAAEAAAAKAAAEAAAAAATASAATPLADQVLALATEAGLADFAAHWALTVASIEAVKPLIAAAGEIRALCVLAKCPDDAAAFIKANASIEKVRDALCARLAAKSESSHIDTTSKSSNSTAGAAQPTAVSTSSIWAARNKAK